jgi:mutator protein MutT
MQIELPEGYEDLIAKHGSAHIINGSDRVCIINSENDAQAARYALSKWENFCKRKAEGLFAVAALVIKDGKVLAVSRKTNHSDFGLAGGKIDPGETSEEAVKRELFEETGLIATKLHNVFEDLDRVEGSKPCPCRTYLIESWEGEPKAMENAIVEWVSPWKLFEEEHSFCKYNIALFDHLNEIGVWNG